jgi:uncharacterized protein
MVPSRLLETIRRDFALSLRGIHGEAHWARVCENGLHLAQRTGADVEIVELFAYLHDSKRQNDGWDRDHGHRAAEFPRALDGSMLELPAPKLERLIYACTHHSDGLTEADVTVQTCWDADRLDLGRIGTAKPATSLHPRRPGPGRDRVGLSSQPAASPRHGLRGPDA